MVASTYSDGGTDVRITPDARRALHAVAKLVGTPADTRSSQGAFR
jgi:hypothetical protein